MRRPQKFEKTFHLNSTILSNFKKSGRFFQNVWPSHNICTLQTRKTVWWRRIGIKKMHIWKRGEGWGGRRKYRKNCLRTLWTTQNFWQEKPIFFSFLPCSFHSEKDINNRKPNQTVSFFCKVHILWEGQKVWKNLPLFLKLLCSVKFKWDFFFKFFWPSKNIWTLGTLSYTTFIFISAKYHGEQSSSWKF